jgi:hypothetical protein
MHVVHQPIKQKSEPLYTLKAIYSMLDNLKFAVSNNVLNWLLLLSTLALGLIVTNYSGFLSG